MPDLGKTQALAALAERRARPPIRLDNAALHAGAPMYFYCRTCGHLAAVLPEDYRTPPPRFCVGCQSLHDLGWLKETP